MTERERRFVEAYSGNGASACRAAGYSGSVQALSTQAKRLLGRPRVRQAIEARRAPAAAGRVMSRAERQALWSAIALDEGQKVADRLRASELLGKSEADFTEKVQHSAGQSLETLLVEALAKP